MQLVFSSVPFLDLQFDAIGSADAFAWEFASVLRLSLALCVSCSIEKTDHRSPTPFHTRIARSLHYRDPLRVLRGRRNYYLRRLYDCFSRTSYCLSQRGLGWPIAVDASSFDYMWASFQVNQEGFNVSGALSHPTSHVQTSKTCPSGS